MPYGHLDDQLHAHRKARRAWKEPRALGLYLLAISYVAGQMTDGVVDREFVEEKLPDAKERRKVTAALVSAGLWEPHQDGWVIHDWLDHNESKADIKGRRRRDRARKRPDSRRNPDGIPEDSTRIPHGIPTESAGTPGREGKGKERKRDRGSGGEGGDLFAYWQKQCGHPTARPTRDRLSKVDARLRDGYTPDQIKQAIDGAARAAFVNDQGKRFDDLELICRSGSKLEDFIGRNGQPAQDYSAYDAVQEN